MKNFQETIAKVVEENTKKIQEIENQAILESHTNIAAKVYGNATNYTNFVIFAGYAGLFSFITLSREHIVGKTFILCLALAALSLIGFMAFELFKMIVTALSARKAAMIIRSPKSLQDIKANVEDYETRMKQVAMLTFAVWPFFLIPIVLSGFASAFLLLYNWLAYVFEFRPWPFL